MKKDYVFKNLKRFAALMIVFFMMLSTMNIPVSADAESETSKNEAAEDVQEAAVSEEENGIVLAVADITEDEESLLPDFETAISSMADDISFGISMYSVNKVSDEFVQPMTGAKEIFKSIEKKRSSQKKIIASASASTKDIPEELTYKYNEDMVKDVTEKEYEILCRIVQAEAGDQDVYGRILVANVVLNRVNWTKEFKNDIEGVVFEKGQFSPITDGAYYRVKVDETTMEAVNRCLAGEDYSDGALFFFMRSGTSKKAAAWFDSLDFVLKYGCHEFFKY